MSRSRESHVHTYQAQEIILMYEFEGARTQVRQVYVNVCIFVCLCEFLYLCVDIYICVSICIYICMYICIYIHMCIHKYYVCVYIYMYICIYVYMYKSSIRSPVCQEWRATACGARLRRRHLNIIYM